MSFWSTLKIMFRTRSVRGRPHILLDVFRASGEPCLSVTLPRALVGNMPVLVLVQQPDDTSRCCEPRSDFITESGARSLMFPLSSFLPPPSPAIDGSPDRRLPDCSEVLGECPICGALPSSAFTRAHGPERS